MNLVVYDLEGCALYLDDLVVFADSVQEHLDYFGAELAPLDQANLTINLAKWDFAKGTVVYLGHLVGQGAVRPVQCTLKCKLLMSFHHLEQ